MSYRIELLTSPEQLAEMRAWLTDCFSEESEAIAAASDLGILQAVARYCDGWDCGDGLMAAERPELRAAADHLKDAQVTS